ncbi:MAG: DUF2163 domain-containing protein [Pseudomonadota bacterium]
MREIPELLQASLDTGATTLARCWRLERRDAVVMGFTDHDQELSFDNLLFEPESGLTPSALESVTGLAADSHQVSGALSSERISDEDISKGLFDGADVTLYLVNWRDVDQRIVLSRGQIGEIRRGDTAFEAEIVGLSDKLNQPFGRAYLHSGDYKLDATEHGIDLTDPLYLGQGSVDFAIEAQQFSVTGLSNYADSWFTNGVLTWTSGANLGMDAHVKAHRKVGEETVVEIWLSPPGVVLPGDTFDITVGCGRTAEEYAEKFGSIVNFRGFPHMPGDDVAASYPNRGGRHDGRSLFRS